MIFWDASALLPLLVWEEETLLREKQLRKDSVMVVWWGSRIECHSAIRRRERETVLSADSMQKALKRLKIFSESWYEVAPTEILRLRSERFLNSHSLRAADSLQLAAAVLACEEKTADFLFYTSDERLSRAAKSEGFIVG